MIFHIPPPVKLYYRPAIRVISPDDDAPNKIAWPLYQGTTSVVP